ncbi:MAG: hypothetical protein QM757_23320 [Paludibaculum sp.]
MAVQLDPLSIAIQDSMGLAYLLARRSDQHWRSSSEGSRFTAAHYKFVTGMGRVYTHMGRYDEALALFRRTIDAGRICPACWAPWRKPTAWLVNRTRLEHFSANCRRWRAIATCRPRRMRWVTWGWEKEIALEWLEGACERELP